MILISKKTIRRKLETTLKYLETTSSYENLIKSKTGIARNRVYKDTEDLRWKPWVKEDKRLSRSEESRQDSKK